MSHDPNAKHAPSLYDQLSATTYWPESVHPATLISNLTAFELYSLICGATGVTPAKVLSVPQIQVKPQTIYPFSHIEEYLTTKKGTDLRTILDQALISVGESPVEYFTDPVLKQGVPFWRSYATHPLFANHRIFGPVGSNKKSAVSDCAHVVACFLVHNADMPKSVPQLVLAAPPGLEECIEPNPGPNDNSTVIRLGEFGFWPILEACLAGGATSSDLNSAYSQWHSKRWNSKMHSENGNGSVNGSQVNNTTKIKLKDGGGANSLSTSLTGVAGGPTVSVPLFTALTDTVFSNLGFNGNVVNQSSASSAGSCNWMLYVVPPGMPPLAINQPPTNVSSLSSTSPYRVLNTGQELVAGPSGASGAGDSDITQLLSSLALNAGESLYAGIRSDSLIDTGMTAALSIFDEFASIIGDFLLSQNSRAFLVAYRKGIHLQGKNRTYPRTIVVESFTHTPDTPKKADLDKLGLKLKNDTLDTFRRMAQMLGYMGDHLSYEDIKDSFSLIDDLNFSKAEKESMFVSSSIQHTFAASAANQLSTRPNRFKPNSKTYHDINSLAHQGGFRKVRNPRTNPHPNSEQESDCDLPPSNNNNSSSNRPLPLEQRPKNVEQAVNNYIRAKVRLGHAYRNFHERPILVMKAIMHEWDPLFLADVIEPYDCPDDPWCQLARKFSSGYSILYCLNAVYALCAQANLKNSDAPIPLSYPGLPFQLAKAYEAALEVKQSGLDVSDNDLINSYIKNLSQDGDVEQNPGPLTTWGPTLPDGSPNVWDDNNTTLISTMVWKPHPVSYREKRKFMKQLGFYPLTCGLWIRVEDAIWVRDYDRDEDSPTDPSFTVDDLVKQDFADGEMEGSRIFLRGYCSLGVEVNEEACYRILMEGEIPNWLRLLLVNSGDIEMNPGPEFGQKWSEVKDSVSTDFIPTSISEAAYTMPEDPVDWITTVMRIPLIGNSSNYDATQFTYLRSRRKKRDNTVVVLNSPAPDLIIPFQSLFLWPTAYQDDAGNPVYYPSNDLSSATFIGLEDFVPGIKTTLSSIGSSQIKRESESNYLIGRADTTQASYFYSYDYKFLISSAAGKTLKDDVGTDNFCLEEMALKFLLNWFDAMIMRECAQPYTGRIVPLAFQMSYFGNQPACNDTTQLLTSVGSDIFPLPVELANLTFRDAAAARNAIFPYVSSPPELTFNLTLNTISSNDRTAAWFLPLSLNYTSQNITPSLLTAAFISLVCHYPWGFRFLRSRQHVVGLLPIHNVNLYYEFVTNKLSIGGRSKVDIVIPHATVDRPTQQDVAAWPIFTGLTPSGGLLANAPVAINVQGAIQLPIDLCDFLRSYQTQLTPSVYQVLAERLNLCFPFFEAITAMRPIFSSLVTRNISPPAVAEETNTTNRFVPTGDVAEETTLLSILTDGSCDINYLFPGNNQSIDPEATSAWIGATDASGFSRIATTLYDCEGLGSWQVKCPTWMTHPLGFVSILREADGLAAAFQSFRSLVLPYDAHLLVDSQNGVSNSAGIRAYINSVLSGGRRGDMGANAWDYVKRWLGRDLKAPISGTNPFSIFTAPRPIPVCVDSTVDNQLTFLRPVLLSDSERALYQNVHDHGGCQPFGSFMLEESPRPVKLDGRALGTWSLDVDIYADVPRSEDSWNYSAYAVQNSTGTWKGWEMWNLRIAAFLTDATIPSLHTHSGDSIVQITARVAKWATYMDAYCTRIPGWGQDTELCPNFPPWINTTAIPVFDAGGTPQTVAKPSTDVEFCHLMTSQNLIVPYDILLIGKADQASTPVMMSGPGQSMASKLFGKPVKTNSSSSSGQVDEVRGERVPIPPSSRVDESS